MSGNSSAADNSFDEMLDQIQMETAPWGEEEEFVAKETQLFAILNCTEEPLHDDESYGFSVESNNQLKTSEITFDESDPSNNGFYEVSLEEPMKTLATRIRNTRSSIFAISEEPTAFKFTSMFDQSSDFGNADEPGRESILKQNGLPYFVDTDTSDSEIEEVIESPIKPLLKTASPPPPSKEEKKSNSRRLKKMFSKIRRVFGAKSKKS